MRIGKWDLSDAYEPEARAQIKGDRQLVSSWTLAAIVAVSVGGTALVLSQVDLEPQVPVSQADAQFAPKN